MNRKLCCASFLVTHTEKCMCVLCVCVCVCVFSWTMLSMCASRDQTLHTVCSTEHISQEGVGIAGVHRCLSSDQLVMRWDALVRMRVNKIFCSLTAELPDLIVEVPFPLTCQSTWYHLWWEHMSRKWPIFNQQPELAAVRVTLKLHAYFSWPVRGKVEMVVLLDLRHLPTVPSKERDPVIDWHHHFTTLGPHQLWNIHISWDVHHVNQVLQAAHKYQLLQ